MATCFGSAYAAATLEWALVWCLTLDPRAGSDGTIEGSVNQGSRQVMVRPRQRDAHAKKAWQ